MNKKEQLLLCFLIILASCAKQSSPTTLSESLQNQVDSLIKVNTDTTELVNMITSLAYQSWLNARMPESLQLLNYSLTYRPSDHRALIYKARSLSCLGRTFESEKIYHQLINEDSAISMIYSELALSYFFQGKKEEASAIVNSFIGHEAEALRKEIFSVAAALAVHNDEYQKAVNYLLKRYELSLNNWDVEENVLSHPYWDLHLIGNIYLKNGQYDSAVWWYQKAESLADSTLEDRPLRITKSNTDFFKCHYLIANGQLDSAYYYVKENFESNKNGFGAHWARIMIARNDPDSALKVLQSYCRGGYQRMFLEGKALNLKGQNHLTRLKFDSVMTMNHIGNLWWQHEYALTLSLIRNNENGP